MVHDAEMGKWEMGSTNFVDLLVKFLEGNYIWYIMQKWDGWQMGSTNYVDLLL